MKSRFLQIVTVALSILFLIPFPILCGFAEVRSVSSANGSLLSEVRVSPSVSAQSAILMEAESGEALFEKSADTRLPMASTTKIMTALAALEHASPETVVTVPREAVGIEGSSIYQIGRAHV